MTKNATFKKNSIKLVEFLSESPVSRTKVLDELKIKPSTLYRYLNIIKKAGFKVIRKNSSYSILIFYNELELQEYEKSMLAYILFCVHFGLASKKIKTFETALNKMLTVSCKKNYEDIIKKYKYFKTIILGKEYAKKIEVIEKHIKEKTKLKVSSAKNIEQILTPIELNWDNNGLNINFINESNKIIQIPIEKISKITPTNQKEYLFSKKETFFELYGKLAKSYLLKEEERIVDYCKDKLVVANASVDKYALFKRLLRYDSLCKIILPKEDVENFYKLINLSIENLDKLKDNISDFTKV